MTDETNISTYVTRDERVALVLRQQLGGDNVDDATIRHLAVNIMWHMCEYKIAQQGRGGVDYGRRKARLSGPQPAGRKPVRLKPVGLLKELKRIEVACRKTISGKISPVRWLYEWAALSDRTKALLWKRRVVERQVYDNSANKNPIRERSIDTSECWGLTPEKDGSGEALFIAPKPARVHDAIKAELMKATARPAQARKPDASAKDAIEAVRKAYSALTGCSGSRVSEGGRLRQLGQAVDDIFHTRLFAASDSSRYKNLDGK